MWWNYIWTFIGAMAAITVEFIYRKHEGSFDQIFMIIMPIALIVTYGVYNAMRLGSSLLAGIIIWSGMTATIRIFVTLFILKEQPTPAVWAAFGCIIAAQFITKLWR